MRGRQTVLALAEEVAGATEAQVLLGDLEAVVGRVIAPQPLAGSPRFWGSETRMQ